MQIIYIIMKINWLKIVKVANICSINNDILIHQGTILWH
jgi:hypothetical protein